MHLRTAPKMLSACHSRQKIILPLMNADNADKASAS